MKLKPRDPGGPDGGFLFTGPVKDGFFLSNKELLVVVQVITILRAPEFEHLRQPLFETLNPCFEAVKERMKK